jgi:hypothetical protein
MSNYILYLAGSDANRVNECRYSLLKYLALYNLKPPANIGIVIYSGVPAIFESFDPFFEQFELKETTEPLPSKLEFINKALELKERNVLYMEPDSYFTTPVDSIFENLSSGDLLFYTKKQTDYNDAQFNKIRELLSSDKISIDEPSIGSIQKKGFYSTEIIGLNTKALPLVQKMTDLYSKLALHLPAEISEEFACNYYASDAAVETLENKATSYRNFHQFKNLLRLFFEKNQEENIPNLVKLMHHIDAQTILQEKKQYDSQPFVKKLLSALAGKAWSVRRYQNKF